MNALRQLVEFALAAVVICIFLYAFGAAVGLVVAGFRATSGY